MGHLFRYTSFFFHGIYMGMSAMGNALHNQARWWIPVSKELYPSQGGGGVLWSQCAHV